MKIKLLKYDLYLQIESYKSYIKILENTSFNMLTQRNQYDETLEKIKSLEQFILDCKNIIKSISDN
jgi:hypothetical protein